MTGRFCCSTLALFLLFFSTSAWAAFSEPSNATYECQPNFQASVVPPNILIMLDNSGSMTGLAVPGSDTYEGTPLAGNKSYYGYFNPDYFYQYGSNEFSHKYKKVQYVGTPGSGGYWQVEDLSGNLLNLTDAMIETGNSNGLWDGNFMNYAAMRKIDVVRKVLMGGLATSRQGGGNQTNIGYSSTNYYNHGLNDPGVAVTPYGGSRIYEVYNGYLDVYSDWTAWGSWSYVGRFTIKVDKQQSYEPQDFVDGNIAGVLQKIGDRARWGNEWFYDGVGNNESGGFISNTIGTNMPSLITDLQNTAADTWTPLAEAYYVAIQYFAQEDIDYSATQDYKNSLIPNNNTGQDPYHNGTDYVSCAKSFVILLTDGASTMDSDIPSYLKDFDGDGNDDTSCSTSDESNYATCDYVNAGTDYLDDLALYARTTDLRSATKGKTEIDGNQNLILYTIYANFGSNDPNAENLLRDAAINGGFEDRNGNNIPDLTAEYDADGDGEADNFLNAEDGYELESKLLKAINDILKRTASGTAVSVLATSNEGEGNITQAFFKPQITSGTTDIEWLGYLQSFWVDSYGNLREDSINDPDHSDTQCQNSQPNHKLDVECDKIISFFVDSLSGDTKIKRYDVSSTTPYPDLATASYEQIGIDEAAALWQAGKNLAEKDPDHRNIFTYLDLDNNDLVDDPNGFSGAGEQWQDGVSYSQFDQAYEIVAFDDNASSQTLIAPYLGVRDDATWSELGASQADRVANIINYVRGSDLSGLRSRTFDYDNDGVDETWKLGDIVHSTPVSIGKPPDNYHVIYSDQSYQYFYDAFKERETVVYVGANDGMLHAFTSWQYDSATQTYSQPYGTTEDIGDELWAYIPQSLLPHLKWLPSNNYIHTYYVDMKPKAFDAQILSDDTHYVDPDIEDNWGSFLLVGFNLGGGFIQAKEDFDYNGSVLGNEVRNFYPSYTLIDITEPRNPKILWERSYENMQASSTSPAVVRVDGQWFAVFGSGPSGCSGTSGQTSHIYVVDLATGEPYQDGSSNDYLFTTGSSNSFISPPVSLDKNLNYNVDAIYLGEANEDGSGGSYAGKLFKIHVPWICGSTDATTCYNYAATLDYGSYASVPNDGTHPWKLSQLYELDGPITASPSLSVDKYGNTWIFGGTGRYYNETDKTDTSDQFIFGIKDPLYNSNYAPTTLTSWTATSYYRNYANYGSLTFPFSPNMLDVSDYGVSTAGAVYNGTSYVSSFSEFLYQLRSNYDGWSLTLTNGERLIRKPVLLGGIAFSTTFNPSSTTCSYGGTSSLWGLYFESGTAYTKAVFLTEPTYDIDISGTTKTFSTKSIDLGQGLASRLGVHVGGEQGAKAFIQQSTGEIRIESVTPALNIKSGIRDWKEKLLE